MPEGAALRVEGYRELVRSFSLLDRKQKREVREILRRTGEKVRTDASSRLAPKDAKSAAGYKTRVRQRGVAVEQSLRKTTGLHPEWGSYQMRHALLPATYDNETYTRLAMERAMDELAAWFNAKGQMH